MCHLILFLPAFALPIFGFFPLKTALPIYSAVTGLSCLIYYKIFRAMRQKVRTGWEGMVGKMGIVIQDIDPEGKVQYAGEIWGARTKSLRLCRGNPVKICGFQGLMLQVEAMSNDGETGSAKPCH